jgi:hypothetical protein
VTQGQYILEVIGPGGGRKKRLLMAGVVEAEGPLRIDGCEVGKGGGGQCERREQNSGSELLRAFRLPSSARLQRRLSAASHPQPVLYIYTLFLDLK